VFDRPRQPRFRARRERTPTPCEAKALSASRSATAFTDHTPRAKSYPTEGGVSSLLHHHRNNVGRAYGAPLLHLQVTILFCRLPLPTFFHAREAAHLGDLMRFRVRLGVGPSLLRRNSTERFPSQDERTPLLHGEGALPTPHRASRSNSFPRAGDQGQSETRARLGARPGVVRPARVAASGPRPSSGIFAGCPFGGTSFRKRRVISPKDPP